MLSLWTGIPVYKLTEEETEALLQMEDELHKRVIGQETPWPPCRSRSVAPGRPEGPEASVGSFIFLGPTGVGKTELAKTLAEFLFGDETR